MTSRDARREPIWKFDMGALLFSVSGRQETHILSGVAAANVATSRPSA